MYGMRIIKRLMLVDFGQHNPEAAEPLDRWYRIARRARWTSLADVRIAFPHADVVKVASGNRVTVFNIGGNKYRLITAIHYNRHLIYTLRVMTHAEYCRGKWKEQL
jgi:mRNA interferase HigB